MSTTSSSTSLAVSWSMFCMRAISMVSGSITSSGRWRSTCAAASGPMVTHRIAAFWRPSMAVVLTGSLLTHPLGHLVRDRLRLAADDLLDLLGHVLAPRVGGEVDVAPAGLEFGERPRLRDLAQPRGLQPERLALAALQPAADEEEEDQHAEAEQDPLRHRHRAAGRGDRARLRGRRGRRLLAERDARDAERVAALLVDPGERRHGVLQRRDLGRRDALVDHERDREPLHRARRDDLAFDRLVDAEGGVALLVAVLRRATGGRRRAGDADVCGRAGRRRLRGAALAVERLDVGLVRELRALLAVRDRLDRLLVEVEVGMHARERLVDAERRGEQRIDLGRDGVRVLLLGLEAA